MGRWAREADAVTERIDALAAAWARDLEAGVAEMDALDKLPSPTGAERVRFYALANLYNLALAHSDTGPYEARLAGHADASVAHERAGDVAGMRAHQESAVTALEKILEINPEKGHHRIDLAMLLVQIGRRDEARSLLEEGKKRRLLNSTEQAHADDLLKNLK